MSDDPEDKDNNPDDGKVEYMPDGEGPLEGDPVPEPAPVDDDEDATDAPPKDEEPAEDEGEEGDDEESEPEDEASQGDDEESEPEDEGEEGDDEESEPEDEASEGDASEAGDDAEPEADAEEAEAAEAASDDGEAESPEEPAEAEPTEPGDEETDAKAPAPEPPEIHEDDVDEDAVFPGATITQEVGEEELADGQVMYLVDRADLFLAARSVREQGYRILSCLSAADDKKGPMHVFYSFVKPSDTPEDFATFNLKVIVPKVDDEGEAIATTCPSITDIFPGANWHEREMYDMYGIEFQGHPDLTRIFLPEGWKGFPMRKDDNQAEQFVALDEGEDIVLQEQQEGSW